MHPADPDRRWGLVVPVKRLALAKTRLRPYGDAARQELALAFAADVVTAALACPAVERVLVVTDDERARARLAGLGAETAPDDPDAGLNPALAHGAGLLRAAAPGCGVAALSADLPALRPEDLDAALRAVPAGGRGVVRDHAGTGTTLLAAGPGAELAPSYGPGSLDRHLAGGAALLAAAEGLLLDVDTPEDLQRALALGVGAHTAAAVEALTAVRVPQQATVADWDPATGDGTVLLDDGTRLAFPGDAVDPSLQRLRTGQRVHLRLAGERVTALTLSAFPLPD